MKKICYGLCCLLAVMFVQNVYADELLGSIIRGEAYLLENFNSNVCKNTEAYVAFKVDNKCLIINNLSPSVTTPLSVKVYTDTSTSPATEYKIELSSTEIGHQSGRVIPYELTYLINNMNSVAKKFFVDDMNVAYGEADWFINAGCKGDKIYIHYGNEEVSYVVPYAYDSSTKVMSYSYSSVESSDPQFAAALMSHYLFLFLVEADPNFATEAKAIMQDTNKLALVDVADVFDDGTSDWSLSMSGSNTVFNFAMLLIDNKATAFVNSYNSHVASGELPDSSFVSVPEAPVDPDPLPANPPAEEDPTQPTQPTEPGKQPNTGTFMSIVGVAILGVVAGLLIKNKKSKFGRI